MASQQKQAAEGRYGSFSDVSARSVDSPVHPRKRKSGWTERIDRSEPRAEIMQCSKLLQLSMTSLAMASSAGVTPMRPGTQPHLWAPPKKWN